MNEDSQDIFPTSSWSTIVKAQSYEEDERQDALRALLERYWKAAFLFLAKKFSLGAQDRETAMDVLHDFFQTKMRCSSSLLESDVKDAAALGRRLRGSADPVFAWLRDQLSPETWRCVEKFTDGPTQVDVLREALVQDFNRILRECRLWLEKPFAEARWSQETRALLTRVVESPPRNPTRVNRLLLEEVCHRELVRCDDFFAKLDQEKGKFRSYLVRSLANWRRQQIRFSNARKRGGGCILIAGTEDVADNEQLMATLEGLQNSELTPEQVFLQQYGQDLLDHADAALEREYDRLGKGALARALLATEKEQGKQRSEALAKRFGMTAAAVRKFKERLRRRRRELIREEVRITLANPTDEAVREEVQALFEELGWDLRPPACG